MLLQAIRAAGSEIDITDRKHCREALKKSEALYRLLADTRRCDWDSRPIRRLHLVSPSVFPAKRLYSEEVIHQTLEE